MGKAAIIVDIPDVSDEEVITRLTRRRGDIEAGGDAFWADDATVLHLISRNIEYFVRDNAQHAVLLREAELPASPCKIVRIREAI